MENQKQSKSTQYALIVLLLLSLVANVFQFKNNRDDVQERDFKIDTLETVRIDLEKELATSGLELEKYRGISANLDTLLNDANDKIAAQEAKIRKLISTERNQGKLNKKLKAELEELRKLKEEYLEKIDQLITENEQLKQENEIKAAAINQLYEEKKGLQTKITTASQLRAEYVKVNAYKKRNSGKFVETSLAKRTNKLEVKLTVMDNKVAEPGDKMVYIIIKEPTGKILAGASMTKFNMAETNEEMDATASYKLSYNGEKQDVALAYEGEDKALTPGTYSIEVYIDGTLVNTSNYILR
jgi:chromosome segregation ATPase